MKINPFLTFGFVLIAIILYVQFLGKTGSEEVVPLPEGLNPIVAERTERLLRDAEAIGINVIITDDFRSFDEQNQLYARGRTIVGSVVTNAKGGESYHNFGLAVDFAIKTNDGKVIWDMGYDGNLNGRSDWEEVVEIAKLLGFEWGGDWRHFKDYPHLQMNFGLSIRELQKGERPQEESFNASGI